jgi:hypothetical protein
LERLLGTRRTPLGERRMAGEAAAAAGDEAESESEGGAGSPLGDDRLLSFGLEHPRRTVVTVDLDLRTLEEVVRRCIKRHLPWVTKVEVSAGRADPSKDGRIVVPIEIHVGSPRETTLRLNLHRLARDVEVTPARLTAKGGVA